MKSSTIKFELTPKKLSLLTFICKAYRSEFLFFDVDIKDASFAFSSCHCTTHTWASLYSLVSHLNFSWVEFSLQVIDLLYKEWSAIPALLSICSRNSRCFIVTLPRGIWTKFILTTRFTILVWVSTVFDYLLLNKRWFYIGDRMIN